MAMIVENTFTGIPNMAQLMFPGVSIFPYFCFKNRVCEHAAIYTLITHYPLLPLSVS